MAEIRVGKTLLLTLREAAKRYNVGHNTLARAVQRGELKGIRVGRYCLVEPAEVVKWKREFYHAGKGRPRKKK